MNFTPIMGNISEIIRQEYRICYLLGDCNFAFLDMVYTSYLSILLTPFAAMDLLQSSYILYQRYSKQRNDFDINMNKRNYSYKNIAKFQGKISSVTGWIFIHITVTSWWARWRLESPASRLFIHPFVEAQVKENIKAPRYWPLWEEFTGDRRVPCTKGQ